MPWKLPSTKNVVIDDSRTYSFILPATSILIINYDTSFKWLTVVIFTSCDIDLQARQTHKQTYCWNYMTTLIDGHYPHFIILLQFLIIHWAMFLS